MGLELKSDSFQTFTYHLTCTQEHLSSRTPSATSQHCTHSTMAAVRCAVAATCVTAAWGLVPPPATQARHTTLQAKRPDYVPGVISDPGYVRIFDTTLRDG